MKIDCNNAANFLKELLRYWNSEYCNDFYAELDSDDICEVGYAFCKDLLSNHNIEDFIAKLQTWSDAHPAKTYRDDFLEKFPKAPLGRGEMPKPCVSSLYGDFNYDCNKAHLRCSNCWNRPMENFNG